MSIRRIAAFVAPLVLIAGPAFADEEMSIRNMGTQPYSIELKPLPTALTAIPQAGALGSLGVGTEAFVTTNVSWLVNATYVDVHLPNNELNRATDANSNQAVIRTQTGYEVATGARIYSSPFTDSWYAEGDVGYTDIRGSFAYQDVDVSSHVISVMPTVMGGYRWLFRNNMLLRIGAGGAVNAVQSRTATASNPASTNAAEGEYKVRNIQRTPLLAQLDLGLGYAF